MAIACTAAAIHCRLLLSSLPAASPAASRALFFLMRFSAAICSAEALIFSQQLLLPGVVWRVWLARQWEREEDELRQRCGRLIRCQVDALKSSSSWRRTNGRLTNQPTKVGWSRQGRHARPHPRRRLCCRLLKSRLSAVCEQPLSYAASFSQRRRALLSPLLWPTRSILLPQLLRSGVAWPACQWEREEDQLLKAILSSSAL